jgi:hypothetical protein
MTEVLTDIPFSLTAEQVLRRARLRNRNTLVEEMVAALVDSVNRIARPRAVYRVAYIDAKNDDSVVIEGVTFTSRLLRHNLEKPGRVFPYIATCGRELDEMASPGADIVESFFLDVIKGMAVRCAVDFLVGRIQEKYAPGKVSHMNPGSLTDWPITQQPQLFALFANVEELIGVRLGKNCAMYPVKSLSGICFPTEIPFYSCQLCTRENCPSRKAAYDQLLARHYGIMD